MTGPRLVLATANAHKVEEIEQILFNVIDGFDPTVLATMEQYDVESPVEDGTTFAANALIKAKDLAQATGLPALADDSGLCVDILGGSPGVFSARWSGVHGDDEANVALLLAQLRDVPTEQRGARFLCAAALAFPDGRSHVVEGAVEGTLTKKVHGAGGFGYDPIFRPTGEDRTTAQLSREEKNAISHRFRALQGLAPELVRVLGVEDS